MIERIKKKAAAFLVVCMMAVLFQGSMLTAYAADGRIAFSDPSVQVGQQVTINMEVTAQGANLLSADVTLSYDPNALEFVEGTDAEGGAGAVRVHGDGGTPNTSELAFQLTFNALSAGSTAIQVTNQEVYDADSQLVNITRLGSSAVTVQALSTASEDASLKSLQISPGSLSPAFSPDVDAYTVSVGTDVDKLIISAETSDENASLIINGNENLQMGENRVTCQVTAQDGETTREYVITVTKEEGGASSTAAATGEEVKLYSSAKTITILEPEEGVTLPEGFIENPVEIDGHTVRGWVWEADPERQYCVVYGMNEAGEKNFYRFDLKENTIQRYFQDPASADAITEEKYNQLAELYNNLTGDYRVRGYVIAGLAAVSVLLLILVAVLLHLYSRRGKSSQGSMKVVPRENQKKENVPDKRPSRRRKEPEPEPESETEAEAEEEAELEPEEDLDLEIVEELEPEPENPAEEAAEPEAPEQAAQAAVLETAAAEEPAETVEEKAENDSQEDVDFELEVIDLNEILYRDAPQEAKQETKQQPKQEAKQQAKQEPKPKPEPKTEPKPEPKAEPAKPSSGQTKPETNDDDDDLEIIEID